MKFYCFVFDTYPPQLLPWDNSAMSQEESVLLNSPDFDVLAEQPNEYGKQTIWITELVRNMYPDFLKRYELIEKEIVREQLLELGARSRFHSNK